MSGTTRLILIAALLAVVLAGAAMLAGYPSELTPGQSDDAGHGKHEAHRPPTISPQQAP